MEEKKRTGESTRVGSSEGTVKAKGRFVCLISRAGTGGEVPLSLRKPSLLGGTGAGRALRKKHLLKYCNLTELF